MLREESIESVQGSDVHAQVAQMDLPLPQRRIQIGPKSIAA